MARDLRLPPPVVRLRAPPPGPDRIGTLARRLEVRLAALKPSLVAVLGDVDSTLAAALAAGAVALAAGVWYARRRWVR